MVQSLCQQWNILCTFGLVNDAMFPIMARGIGSIDVSAVLKRVVNVFAGRDSTLFDFIIV